MQEDERESPGWLTQLCCQHHPTPLEPRPLPGPGGSTSMTPLPQSYGLPSPFAPSFTLLHVVCFHFPLKVSLAGSWSSLTSPIPRCPFCPSCPLLLLLLSCGHEQEFRDKFPPSRPPWKVWSPITCKSWGKSFCFFFKAIHLRKTKTKQNTPPEHLVQEGSMGRAPTVLKVMEVQYPPCLKGNGPLA